MDADGKCVALGSVQWDKLDMLGKLLTADDTKIPADGGCYLLVVEDVKIGMANVKKLSKREYPFLVVSDPE